jgi:hypothetical protein
MDIDLVKELLNELGTSLESLETQQGALFQFLKDKGIVSDNQMVPYLDQAGNASSIRWRATRLRLERVFSTAADKEEQAAKLREDQTKKQTQQKEAERAKGKSTSQAPGKKPATGRTLTGEERASTDTKSATPEANDLKKNTKNDEKKPSAAERADGTA